MIDWKITKWKFKRAVKGMFRNHEAPLCEKCEYSGCMKSRIAKFVGFTHIVKADCYFPDSEKLE